jgi:uncharacterized membrane protein YhaH (DUF805 family)
MTWIIFLFDRSGRLSRAQYWIAAIVYTVVYAVVLSAAIAGSTALIMFSSLFSPLIFLIPALYIGLLIPYITLAVRRLHDRNKGGGWAIPFLLAPFAVSFVSGANDAAGFAGDTTMMSLILVGVALTLWGVVEVGFLPGTKGPNEYGPDPREKRGATAAVFE